MKSKIRLVISLTLFMPIIFGPKLLADNAKSGKDEIIIKMADTIINKINFIRQGTILRGTPKKVWSVLTSPQKAKSFMPKVKEYRVIENGKDYQLIHCEGKPHWLMSTFKCLIRVDLVPYTQIHWKKINGDLKSLEGYWWLSEVNNEMTLAIYAVNFEPGNLIPQNSINNAIANDLPDMLRKIRQYFIESANSKKLRKPEKVCWSTTF